MRFLPFNKYLLFKRKKESSSEDNHDVQSNDGVLSDDAEETQVTLEDFRG